MSDSALTGAVLVSGFCVFLTGAAFWKPAVYQQELSVALRAMAKDRKRLRWIQSWMCVGVTVTTLGVALLGALLWTLGERALSILGVGLFALGAVLWLVALLFRFTVEDWAAGQTVETEEVPAGFEAWDRWAGALHSFHMVSAYLSWALLGGALISTAVVPIWLGWSGVVLGVLLSFGFVALKGRPLSPPILAHVFPLAVGISLLV